MLRKIDLGLIAAAALGVAALIPGVASAGGIHFGIGGWNGSYGIHGVYAGPALYVGGLTEGCLRKNIIETRHGQRVRWVNVCAN